MRTNSGRSTRNKLLAWREILLNASRQHKVTFEPQRVYLPRSSEAVAGQTLFTCVVRSAILSLCKPAAPNVALPCPASPKAAAGASNFLTFRCRPMRNRPAASAAPACWKKLKPPKPLPPTALSIPFLPHLAPSPSVSPAATILRACQILASGKYKYQNAGMALTADYPRSRRIRHSHTIRAVCPDCRPARSYTHP